MHANSNMRNKQMVVNTYKVFPFFKISPTHACKMTPFFLISRIRASYWKNTPFFAKMGTSEAYVLVRSGGGAGYESQFIHAYYLAITVIGSGSSLVQNMRPDTA